MLCKLCSRSIERKETNWPHLAPSYLRITHNTSHQWKRRQRRCCWFFYFRESQTPVVRQLKVVALIRFIVSMNMYQFSLTFGVFFKIGVGANYCSDGTSLDHIFGTFTLVGRNRKVH
ncbi:hypothetical protein BV22DRAFT_115945 [Leucogyrophana mollusca]|uniref:Uncharacterized protein n=1 Tax=Leucogyrophana mollusca TaxID=85980 RepID=A0ACB8BUM0_9AGAM|nr:hypothetical protein BV22DRAFT_115945 [Leucogyrophana mollusca]